MLIPPRGSKSAKKPAAKTGVKQPAGAVKKPAVKAKAIAKTIAGAALESLPVGIAKQLVKTESFMKWAKAA
eukprot:6805547-Prymnesium_polylepis.1